jgi:hypothetical protein
VRARLDETTLAQVPGKTKLKIAGTQDSSAHPYETGKNLAFGRH